MVIPPWLAHLTGASAFANNAANGYQPTIGDALQGIGHSMMEHYRGQQPQYAQLRGGFAGATGSDQNPAHNPAMVQPPQVIPQIVLPPHPQVVPPVLFNSVTPPTIGTIAGLFR